LGRDSAAREQLLDRETNVSRNLPQQRRRNVPAGMERNRRATAVGMAVLPVGSALADLCEAKAFEQGRDFAWLQDRKRPHT